MAKREEMIANVDAEQTVLGSMLIAPDSFFEVQPILVAEDFAYEDHRTIYRAITELVKADTRIDYITVVDWLQRNDELDKVGYRETTSGAAYLSGLISAVPTSVHAVEYAKIVRDHSIRRQLMAAAAQIAKSAYDKTADEALLESLSLLGAVNGHRQTKMVSSHDAVDEFAVQAQEFIDTHSETWGLPTGLKDLDELTGGFAVGEYVVIAGRPGMGKSSLLLQVARHIAEQGKGVAFFSLEMSMNQLMIRLACQGAKLNSKEVRQGKLTEDGKAKLWQELAKIGQLPVWWCCRSGVMASEIESEVAKLRATKGISLVAVDYLQILGDPGDNENMRLTGISQHLQRIPKNQGVCLVAASQLSRDIEKRTEPVPRLSDLRGSGSLEQDSDMVLFIHRKEDTRDCKIILSKNRNGPAGIGLKDVVFLDKYTIFVDKAKASEFADPF